MDKLFELASMSETEAEGLPPRQKERYAEIKEHAKKEALERASLYFESFGS